MRLPDHQHVVVPERKITESLLSTTHRDGRHKAAFFGSFGFTPDRWQELATALREHAAENDVAQSDNSLFGTRYTVEGIIRAPDGRTPQIRSVWFIEHGGTTPQFVTAYPVKKRAS